MTKPVRTDADRLKQDLSYRATIKRFLETTGWTQLALAEHLDVREATVSDWLKGKARIPKAVVLYCILLMRMKGQPLDEDEDGKKA